MQTIDVSADQIRAARHMLRWTQENLAGRAGISRVTLANLESGKASPRIETLRQIVRILESAGVQMTPTGLDRQPVEQPLPADPPQPRAQPPAQPSRPARAPARISKRTGKPVRAYTRRG